VIVEPRVEQYAEQYSTQPSDLFRRLDEVTRAKTTVPQMMVGQLEGHLLGELVRISGARRILELGTFTGYSSISMALALPPEGRVITCDVDEETNAIARRYAEEAGVIDRIDYRLGPALETIVGLDGPFDIVFIDADKVNYVNYYEATLPLLADDGILLVDNALSSGDVVDPTSAGESARAIHALNERIRTDDRVENVLLTVRDGINLVRRRRD
jgi:caffeoyl-CoA O-methyltransferase